MRAQAAKQVVKKELGRLSHMLRVRVRVPAHVLVCNSIAKFWKQATQLNRVQLQSKQQTA
jgi:hypothetical protein